MQIQVYYDSGLIENFDTQNFCCSEPFEVTGGKNITTDFKLRLDDINKGLMLQVFWYSTTLNEFTNKSEDAETGAIIPHAMRETGRNILLISANEMNSVVRILVDGQVVIWREGSYLVNAVKFKNQEYLCYAEDSCESINYKAFKMYEYLKKAYPNKTEDEICEMIGLQKGILREIIQQEIANGAAEVLADVHLEELRNQENGEDNDSQGNQVDGITPQPNNFDENNAFSDFEEDESEIDYSIL